MRYKVLNENLTAYRHQPGVGPTVVFINSLGGDQTIWDDVIAHLGTATGTVTYDLRGHGASGATPDPYTIDLLSDDLIALMDHLGLEDVVLCGASVGGLIAQAAALKKPACLRGLVLNNTAARIGTTDRWNDRIGAVNRQGFDPIAESALDLWFAPAFKTQHPDARAGYKAMLLRNDPIGYVNTCAALRDCDLSNDTAKITYPTICITGDQDKSVLPTATADLAQKITGATLRTIAGSGHLPCIEAPSDVAEILREMINTISMSQDRATAGLAVRRSVLGDTHVDKAHAQMSDFDAAFQSLITEGAWGTVWASNAISRRERSMITLALLAALGNFDEIPMHVRATRRTGATATDIQEAFQHVAIYAGVPRANRALKLAKQTLAEWDD